MANKRFSEFSELLYNQISSEDLLIITDVSAPQTKKIKVSQLRDFCFYTGSLSGSLYGSASHAVSASWANVISSSYALTSSYVKSSSYAVNAKSGSYSLTSSHAESGSWAFRALTASYAMTSSVQYVTSGTYAVSAGTASYLLYQGFANGLALNATTSSYADLAKSSSFLIYTPGVNNGTVTNAKTASLATTASYVNSASSLIYNGGNNGTASYAMTSSLARYSSYLYKPMAWGVYTATVNSYTESKITTMSFTPLVGSGTQHTIVEAYGTATLKWTSSVSDSGSISLRIRNQSTLLETTLDSTWIGNSFANGTNSGSMTVPYTLIGQEYLTGNYTLFVTASTSNILLDTSRGNIFRIDSRTDNLNRIV